MKKQLIAVILGTATMLWSNDAFSYKKEGSNMPQGGGTNTALEAKGANCAPATAQLTMEFNDVSSFIEQGGSMWQNRQASVAAYEVPKGSGLYAIYAGALWMGGTDVNGQLKLAGLTFRQGNDFWPGPLTVTPGTGNYDPAAPVGDDAVRDFGEANIDPDQCEFYDKFYTIRKSEVENYTLWWECDQAIIVDGCDEIEEPTDELLDRLYSWPAIGDESLGQDRWLAPFYDYNGDAFYDPADGDIPWYDDILGRDDVECGFDRRITLFGDETHWWVFNDKGNIHTESNGDPIGMEIRAQAFAFGTTDEVNRMTFYNYEMINRGTQTLFNTFFSQYIDADVGNYSDDYVGCDVSRGLGYAFNGDNFDEDDGGRPGYGDNPPAIGCDFFEGPYQDADGRDNVGPYFDTLTQTTIVPTVIDAINDTGIVYKGIGVGYSDGIIDNERFGMRRFTYYTNGAAYPYTDPNNAAEFYNFMSGFWANGSETFYGGAGHVGSSGVTITTSDYMFPGDSDPLWWATNGNDLSASFPNGWSEADVDGSGGSNPVGDRRFVQSAGPFTLRPGAVNNITVGIVYGRGTDGDLFSSVEAMRRADTKAQALFDACFKILDPPDAPKLTIQELENELILMIENPATSNNYQEAYEVEDEVNITDPSVDRFYRFEGYMIYQMKDDEAGVADINDPTKARLVAQCDIENGIDRIINFEYDEDLGYDIPTERVDGSDAGIRHTFRITEDQFAQGTRTLVNHKSYYYIAVAYAYNDMADLGTGAPNLYDPTDPLTLDGQKVPFISSRLSFDGTAIKSVQGVPHNPMPEADGTLQQIEYGSTPRITRLDGYGNGNRALELTQESINEILLTGKDDTPTYEYGAGPINVKVVDPLNVAPGYYEILFENYNTTTSNGADTASWTINRYTSQGGTLIESVSSDLSIDNNNEQIIPEWGVSVQITQKNYFLPEGTTGGIEARITDLISADIEFGDSSKLWMNFVPDNDAFYPTNWIRSGTYDPINPDDCLPDNPDYLNPCFYGDQIGADPEKKFAKILGGGVAPHRVVGYESQFMPMAYYNYPSPASAKQGSSISFLPSVDIVITSDKSKWTRVPIIELGRNSALNVGGAEPGELRNSPSVDKNGNPDASGTTGLGWFPGYAIDLESGARLYMAFGENSFLSGENGADMLWNPSDRLVDNSGNPVLGGMHPIYVFSYNNKSINNYLLGYDHPEYNPALAENEATHQLYQDFLTIEGGSSTQKRYTYGSISWVAYPFLTPGQDLLSTDVKMSLRVNKEYKNYVATGQNSGRPMYSWSMDDIATETGSRDQLAEALQMINIVPNPYYAYSEYERNRLDNRVKITNLPERCTVKIYTTNGKLVRTFKKDSPITSIDWDLNNWKGIPLASGVYLIHVDVPEVGEVVLKFFASMRQIDLQGI
jgi:hypothetical protein